MTRTLALVVVLALVTACTSTGPTGPLYPLMSGWEQHFTIESQTAPRGDGFLVWGYLMTSSPYTFHQIRVLVDALDPSSQVIAQQVAWVPGILAWPSRLYFEVPMPPAAVYRVHVFSYDRFEPGRRRLPW